MPDVIDNKAKTKRVRSVSLPAANGRDILEREDWLATAREVLIKEGIAAVKIDRLAKARNVTRGGFYWRFKSHAELLKDLLADWRERNSRSTLAALNGIGTPVERFRAVMDVWLDEIDFDPAYDIAMRDWARISPKVARVVSEVDDERIEAFYRLFLDAGYTPDEATIRARVAYYHQVGYYAIGVRETRERRLAFAELYYRILTGFE